MNDANVKELAAACRSKFGRKEGRKESGCSGGLALRCYSEGGSMADRAFQAEHCRCLAEYSICRKRLKQLGQNCSLEGIAILGEKEEKSLNV